MTLEKVIPFTVIGGFLGSGKTALLNHLLSQAKGQRLYAMVNDFGALNIDAELIAAQNGNQIALSNGCVCCSIGDDFTRALFALLQEDPLPDHIIVEASGVADPARIAAFASIERQLRLNGVAVLVDATAYETHAQDPHLADNYAQQIKAADVLLISKTDLVARHEIDAVHAALERRKPSTPRLEINHGKAPPDVVLGLEGSTPNSSVAPLTDHGLKSFATHISPDMPRAHMVETIESLAPHLLRAKGVLTDSDGAYVIHYAAGRIALEPHEGKSSGHFVLIGTPALPDDAALAALF